MLRANHRALRRILTTEGIEIGISLAINRVCGGSIMRQIRKIPPLVDAGGYGQRLLPLRAGMSCDGPVDRTLRLSPRRRRLRSSMRWS